MSLRYLLSFDIHVGPKFRLRWRPNRVAHLFQVLHAGLVEFEVVELRVRRNHLDGGVLFHLLPLLRLNQQLHQMVLVQNLLVSFGVSDLHEIHSFDGVVLEKVQKIVDHIDLIFASVVHDLGQYALLVLICLFGVFLFLRALSVRIEASVNFGLYVRVHLVVFVGLVPDVIIVAVETLCNFPNGLAVFVEKLSFFGIKLLSRPPFATIKWVQKVLGVEKQLGIVSNFFLILRAFLEWVNEFVAAHELLLLHITELVVLKPLLQFLLDIQFHRFPRQNPLLKCLFLLIQVLPFPLRVQIQQSHGVLHKFALDFLIKHAFCRQTRSMVHLDEPRLEICVHHDIEAQYLKTELIFDIVRLTTAIQVPQ